MVVYTYTKARQNLASLLELAFQDGEVRVRRKDSQLFIIRPEFEQNSPLDVAGLNLKLELTEIVQFIHEGRRFS